MRQTKCPAVSTVVVSSRSEKAQALRFSVNRDRHAIIHLELYHLHLHNGSLRMTLKVKYIIHLILSY